MSTSEAVVNQESAVNQEAQQELTLKDIANTPFKKLVMALCILGCVAPLWGPLVGVAMAAMGFSAAMSASVATACVVGGEIMFFGGVLILGKSVGILIKQKMKAVFSRKK
ncbi:hypothetical protein [Paraferrimonas sedimenticola]|uniref:Uncharacterized protein n=1 Tax=Paraferrimonas sedimenticola TaxID=375674 RepID=A0AA37RW12_9GAMM|nr:hypothetical protein [Paraferrimonas sedimenticola]GLP96063.1 hypothetical protein GCM10007895_13690 [Paraferrimonas sedimenticola]